MVQVKKEKKAMSELVREIIAEDLPIVKVSLQELKQNFQEMIDNHDYSTKGEDEEFDRYAQAWLDAVESLEKYLA